MHPIERLRFVARARHLGPAEAALEAAWALQPLTGEPQGLVVACRRLLERHPSSGPLWWLCARVLVASDPGDALWTSSMELEGDSSHEDALDVVDDDALLVEARAVGPDGFLADVGTTDLAADVVDAGSEVWLVVGPGRALPGRMWEAARDAAVAQEPPVAELVGWGAVTHVMGTGGPTSPEAVWRDVDCPMAPELLLRSTRAEAP